MYFRCFPLSLCKNMVPKCVKNSFASGDRIPGVNIDDARCRVSISESGAPRKARALWAERARQMERARRPKRLRKTRRERQAQTNARAKRVERARQKERARRPKRPRKTSHGYIQNFLYIRLFLCLVLIQHFRRNHVLKLILGRIANSGVCRRWMKY